MCLHRLQQRRTGLSQGRQCPVRRSGMDSCFRIHAAGLPHGGLLLHPETFEEWFNTSIVDKLDIYLDIVTNGTGVIKELFENNCQYIIMREFGIDNFNELITDTKNYISNGCADTDYVSKYKKLGDSTNFFFKKTIYKVKKNG